MTQKDNIQAQDPRGNVFSDLAPILYAAETPVSGSYVVSSMMTATLANAMLQGGLFHKRVLDVGCGYGTTTMSLSCFRPHVIEAIDNSAPMIELMRILMFGNGNLRDYLNEKNARLVLRDLFDSTLNHFIERRREFQTGVFHQTGGVLNVTLGSVMDLKDKYGFDAIVGNNFLHWPVNQLKANMNGQVGCSDERLTDAATITALTVLKNLLRPGGALVLMEPKDFITCDDDSALDDYCEANTMAMHPVFLKLHTIFNRLLKERYDIDRAIPKTTGMFKRTKFEGWCEKAGLRLERIDYSENAMLCNPMNAFYVRLPMVLGKLNLTFDEKMQLGMDTMNELSRTVTSEEKHTFVRGQNFYICARRV